MALIDEGNGYEFEFGSTDYISGKGCFITHREKLKERYVNPEFTIKKKAIIGIFCENNIRLQGYVCYTPATAELSFSQSIIGTNGKKLARMC